MQKHHCLSKKGLILPILRPIVDLPQHVDRLLHHVRIAVSDSLSHDLSGRMVRVLEEAILEGIVAVGYMVSCLPMDHLHDLDVTRTVQHLIEDLNHDIVRLLFARNVVVVGHG